ncbi:hypothetical protein [Dechloromonas sp. A34]|nr:hypothetical protein [Dechloromonas sp. A34]
MNTLPPRWRLHQAVLTIRGTTGEFRRCAILNFCAVALAVLRR